MKNGTALCAVLRFEDFPDTRRDFEDFLVSFSALTARMIQIDCQVLDDSRGAANPVDELISEQYLRCLSSICHHPTSAIWAALHHVQPRNYHTTMIAVAARFIAGPWNGFQHMTTMVKLVLSYAPSLILRIWPSLIVALRMMQLYCYTQDRDLADSNSFVDALQQLPSRAYDMFQAVDELMQHTVVKQIPALTPQLNESLVTQMSALLFAVTKADDRIMDAICERYLPISDELRRSHGPELAELTWKYLVYRKCLTEGRMEIRVQGVDSMQRELISVFERCMNKDTTQYANPVAQHIAGLMLNDRIVDYLVGVDSHPQLISRSGNVVGFLVVTRRYRNNETDAIWRAVTSSQDRRTVDTILLMLRDFISLSDYSTLEYLIQKLNQLPLQAFDESMMAHVRLLLSAIRTQWPRSGFQGPLEMSPYQMCIRLIRIAFADDVLSFHRKRDLARLATTELQLLLRLGPSEADKQVVYDECIADIKARSSFATGGYCIINVLSRLQQEEAVASLATNHDISNLVIEELGAMVKSDTFQVLSTEIAEEHLIARLNLMEVIIKYVPDTIRSDNGQHLWNSMLGKESGLNHTLRDRVWMSLANAVTFCSERNAFIEQCISTYFLESDPALFSTQYALNFVARILQYESRIAASPHDNQKAPVSPRGATLLWHLASTVPSGGIEIEAIRKLVSFYLDSPSAQNSPRTAMESVHMEVVERCIAQLTSSAAKLRAFTDGTSSGEDEPMVIVASEDEIHKQELHFKRSLRILKEFVDGAKARPTYSPPRQAAAQLPSSAQDLPGNLLHLSYQAFNGGMNSGIRFIEVGDLETLADLFQRLVRSTGFRRFMLIVGGQKVNFEKDAQRTLRDAQMDRKGLLIVKKSFEDNTTAEMIPVSELMPLQSEIMKHFHDVYPLLSMESTFAKEV